MKYIFLSKDWHYFTTDAPEVFADGVMADGQKYEKLTPKRFRWLIRNASGLLESDSKSDLSLDAISDKVNRFGALYGLVKCLVDDCDLPESFLQGVEL